MAKTRRGTSVAKGKTPAERCAGRRRSPGSADRPPVEKYIIKATKREEVETTPMQLGHHHPWNP
uniref:Uncharacterized protein n=1 Tax=Oryza rufipogon TaxID=4529 RepID=A0A0E0QRP2_ORYRU